VSKVKLSSTLPSLIIRRHPLTPLPRVINPSNGKVIGEIAEGTEKDIDLAVQAAQKAYNTYWGFKAPGSERGKLLIKLADLIDRDADELASLEALDNGSSSSRSLYQPCLNPSSSWQANLSK
jgi:acyl-CoA reductase-like NAD-dependent aldehyde dehydrogenase